MKRISVKKMRTCIVAFLMGIMIFVGIPVNVSASQDMFPLSDEELTEVSSYENPEYGEVIIKGSETADEANKPEITPKRIKEAIDAMKQLYPEGMHFTNDDPKGGYILSVKLKEHWYRGYGCAGFSFIFSDMIFGQGYYPTSLYYDVEQIKVGDVLRINNDTHSVVVIEVNENGVVIAEANYNYSVHWGRTISFETLRETLTYGFTRYPNLRNGIVYEDGDYWLYEDDVKNTSFSGLYYDQTIGWWLISEGKVDFSYTGLYYDENFGWWLVGNGRVCFEYNGLWGDPVYGWWKIAGGTPDFSYNGLFFDVNCGWWKVSNGTVDFGYTGLYNDAVCGWWLIGMGRVCFEYNGYWSDSIYGDWLIANGGVVFFAV